MEYLSKMKKITSLILSMAFVISFASCKTDTGNSLASISLTKDMRSWSNPGSQYKELLEKQGTRNVLRRLNFWSDIPVFRILNVQARKANKDGV